jgi:hypothetical protein
MSYGRFFAMIATSTVAMFILMYSTVYSTEHVWWSSTKTFMAIYMGATMAVIMLAFMLKMYENKKANIAIFVGSALLFGVVYWVFRAQSVVDDVTYMRQMIPHHSLAILTSERANITDPRVRRLADDIILAQRREIAEMEALIGDLESSDYESRELEPDVPPVEGGSEKKTGPVPGAPALFVDGARLVGDVLVLDSVKVVSDAWVVAHPADADGAADASRVLGRAFVQHGTTPRVPVDLGGAVRPGTRVVLMLHDDTGEAGRFEFGGAGTPDQPLLRGGSPVTAALTVN